ncbi:DUF4157 domain-containing protein [Pseudomonadota bacterium]
MPTFATKEKRPFASTASAFRPARQTLASINHSQQAAVRNIIRSSGAQAKLTIGQPNDKYEREADRVADEVLRMPIPNGVPRGEIGSASPSQVQRTCASCTNEYQSASADKCEVEPANLCPKCRPAALQAKEMPGQAPNVNSAVESRISGLNGGGKPLDANTRSFFEPRFGHDFSSVRLHHGGQASELSRSINARAFTLGNNIVFDSGQYQPESTEGKRLLGHELTHVIQQKSDGVDAATIQRSVHRCCRNIQTGNSILDTLSWALGLEHCWIRTATKEAGMGPEDDGPLPANPIGIDTKITDHTGETGTCREFDADEACVNERLVIGQSTGSWGPLNNCNTFAHQVLMGCTNTTFEPRYMGGGAFMGEDGIVRQGFGAGR